MMHSGKYHGFFVPMFEDTEPGPATIPRSTHRKAGTTEDRTQGATSARAGTHRLRLLILGGYGTFGGRLAELLCEERGLSLVIAGRSQAKADAFCAHLAPGAHRQGVALDRDGDLHRAFAALKPDIVIDATGPFQMYGDDPYRVVKAAIASGAHYLDLADGSDFVRGIGQFDYEAKVQGVAVLSGVSSFPVLTAAVVRLLARDLTSVESITGGIAPSPYAGYGLNVIRAIAGYAGKPVALRRDGRDGVGCGIVEMRRYTVAPPGHVPLQPTEFALVDVPDLTLLADLWPQARDIWMGAGPVPIVLQRVLRVLAKAVAHGWIPTLAPFARVMFYAVNWLRWGEDRGGMFVEVSGRNQAGDSQKLSWHMLAEGDDGPWIPSLAIAAIVKKWLAGLVPPPGARPATQALELSDYQPFFDRRRIVWGLREGSTHDDEREARKKTDAAGEPNARRKPDYAGECEAGRRCLFKDVLGDAFDALPPALRQVHGATDELELRGRAEVTRGTGLIACIAAYVFALPRSGPDVPVAVTFERSAGDEKWTRYFAGHSFSTTLSKGKGRFERLLCERLGPFVFAMAPALERNRLCLVMRGWQVFGMPLPSVLAPRSHTYEEEQNGQFRFHVEIALPVVGLIVRYAGFLESKT